MLLMLKCDGELVNFCRHKSCTKNMNTWAVKIVNYKSFNQAVVQKGFTHSLFLRHPTLNATFPPYKIFVPPPIFFSISPPFKIFYTIPHNANLTVNLPSTSNTLFLNIINLKTFISSNQTQHLIEQTKQMFWFS